MVRTLSHFMFQRPPLSIAALLLATALACSRSETPATADSSVSGMAAMEPAAPSAELSRMAVKGVAGERAMNATADALRVPEQVGSAVSRMLIRRADVSIRVDSLERAMAALQRLATSLGGAVGNVSVSAGDYQVRSATLELRVPAERFDDAMTGMKPIGKVEQSSVTAEDVGEEFVDVSARVANAKRLESRLVDLLATRTGKLEDVLAVERELARVREEIERYQGRIRFLSARVATSTLSVTVSEPAPVVGATPGRSVIGEAFVNAWRNFVALVAWAIESLGVVVPVLALAWLAWRWVRGRRRPEA